MVTTLRYHSGDARCELHNLRDEEFIAHENEKRERTGDNRRINPDGIHKEFSYGLTEKEAFNKLFGDAVERYNAKQTRADRKKTTDSYYKDVLSDCRGNRKKPDKGDFSKPRNGKAVTKEVIVGFGNLDNPVPADVQEAMLRDYVNGFQRRNPNLRMYQCAYHADELTLVGDEWVAATPHIHLDFIPIATGYAKGMDTRCAIGAALQQQGFSGYDAYARWQEQERTVLEDIAKQYGYTLAHPDKGKGKASMDASVYAELEERKRDLDDREKRLEDDRRAFEGKKAEYAVERQKWLKSQNTALQGVRASLNRLKALEAQVGALCKPKQLNDDSDLVAYCKDRKDKSGKSVYADYLEKQEEKINRSKGFYNRMMDLIDQGEQEYRQAKDDQDYLGS